MNGSHIDLKLKSEENKLFLKRFLHHPLQLGTFAPISTKLARFAASCIHPGHHDLIIELGSGTGRLTRELINIGVRPKNIIAVELDKQFCEFLKWSLPEINVIHDNAINLPKLVPDYIGKVPIIISIIPFMYMAPMLRKAIIEACLTVLHPKGTLFHITYSPRSPFKNIDLPIHAKRIGDLWQNIPPGFIWRYQPSE